MFNKQIRAQAGRIAIAVAMLAVGRLALGAEVSLTEFEKDMIAATNEARAKAGVKPLEVDASLMVTARRHTIRMGTSIGMQHGGGPYAENIAMGQRTLADVIRTWLNSSGHRANMLNPRYTKVGVCGYWIRGRGWWTQQFR